MSDEVGRPILPFQLDEGGRIDLEQLSKDNDIPQAAMEGLVALLLEEGHLIETLVPFCSNCDLREGTYEREEDLPQEFVCFYCGESQSIQEATVKVLYPVVKPLDP